MTWVKLDDGFPDHPKVVSAGPSAAWLHLCGLCYCARYLTDGYIPAAQIRRLADVPDADGLARRLVEVGLWERAEGGYAIHDYLDFNPPAQQVKKERTAAAERMRRLRSGDTPAKPPARSPSVRPNTDRTSPEVRPPRPTPVPGPVPAGSRPGRTAAVAAGDGAAAPDSAAPPPELREFHALLSRLDGYEPTVTFFAKVTEKYLGLDLVEEAEKLRSWLADHPRERGSTRRVLNWLREAEDRAAERAARRNGQAVNGRAATVAAPNKYAAAVEAARV